MAEKKKDTKKRLLRDGERQRKMAGTNIGIRTLMARRGASIVGDWSRAIRLRQENGTVFRFGTLKMEY